MSFEPRIASFNVRMFLSFIQADGYNPLSIESVVFVIRNETIAEEIASKYVGTDKSVSNEREGLFQLLHSGPFRPGQLLGKCNDIESFSIYVCKLSKHSPMRNI